MDNISRRNFLQTMGAASLMVAAVPKIMADTGTTITSSSLSANTVSNPILKGFEVFDSTTYKNGLGVTLPKTYVMGSYDIWTKETLLAYGNKVPPGVAADNLKNIGTKLNNSSLAVFDVEHWPLYYHDGFTQLFNEFRKVFPHRRIGTYSMFPVRDYWSPVLYSANPIKYKTRYDDWVNKNTTLLSMTAYADIVFPSLYTFYNDIPGWLTYARDNIQQARRGNKRVIAFLMPVYHMSNAALRDTPIDGFYFRQQLELCYELCDGIVLWGWQPTIDHRSFEWYQEFIAFLEETVQMTV